MGRTTYGATGEVDGELAVEPRAVPLVRGLALAALAQGALGGRHPFRVHGEVVGLVIYDATVEPANGSRPRLRVLRNAHARRR